MSKKRRIHNWKMEEVVNEALKYKTRKEFYKHSSAYSYARKNNILDEVCSHMKQIYKIWDKESLQEEALKYKTKADFTRGSAGAHKSAVKRGILNDICSHMTDFGTKWTFEMLQEKSLKYKIRKDFERGDRASYGYAEKRGLLNIICSHMIKGVSGFNSDKPGILYYLKVETRNFITFKIGVTNLNVKERFKHDELSKIQVIKTWSYKFGKDALEIEQFILNHYKKFKYIGEPLLHSGNTELFNCDVMGLYQ